MYAFAYACAFILRDSSEISRGGGGGGNRGRGHEKWAVKRGRIMQICVRDHVEVHPSFFIL